MPSANALQRKRHHLADGRPLVDPVGFRPFLQRIHQAVPFESRLCCLEMGLICNVSSGLKDFFFLCCCFVSRGFGLVCMAVETATGEEVSVKQRRSFCSSRVPSPPL
ncbi:hypothetical protein EK904_004978 [Melospiza melodia maxima]|nr:hypothetical protein EK904_004978 [Melospiza melodia maxima]